MNAPVKILNLRDLAEEAISASAALNAYDKDDAEWDRLAKVQFEARDRFNSAMADVGLTAPIIRSLMNSGVIW